MITHQNACHVVKPLLEPGVDAGEFPPNSSLSSISRLAARFGVTTREVETVVMHRGFEMLRKMTVQEFLIARSRLQR